MTNDLLVWSKPSRQIPSQKKLKTHQNIVQFFLKSNNKNIRMIVSFKHISHIVLVFDLFEQVNADLANMSMDAETKFVYCQKHVA